MLRGGPQASAQDKQQKQKKRLSFRDPEVESPLRNYLYPAGGKSKTLTRPTKPTNSKKASASVEDLTLEDQALQIAQNVGSAFSDLSITDNAQAEYSGLESIPKAIEAQKETEIRDSSPTGGFTPYQRSCQLRGFKISAQDEEYLDSVVPPLLNFAMRGPSLESGDSNSAKNCIPASEPSLPERQPFSSSIQHQIHMLRYQLEQQNQQTQMAMHQVQLLQDQVEAESTARRKAQEQNNQLMQQNKELLLHMEKLFQQIEDLEKQVQVLEQEKRGKRVTMSPERQAPSVRQPTQSTYTLSRKPSTEQANEKPMLQNRSLAARRSSLTSTKPLAVTTSRISATQNSTSTSAGRKAPSYSPRSAAVQAKPKDSGTKEKEALRIGDTSPPVMTQSGTTSPFGAWKIKSPDSSAQPNADKTGVAVRSRTGSFSSYGKKPQEGATAKSTLFGGNNSSLSSTSIAGKKHSSSTSDLYNPPSAFQGKSSLMIEEPSATVKNAVSNLSISAISKLPRYQHYTGWQRTTSLTNEGEQVSAVSKDTYKSPPQTSLFNR